MLVIQIDELILNMFQSLFNSFQNQVMPVRRKAEELAEVRHVVFKNHHNNMRLDHAIVSSEFQKPLWLLYKDRLLLILLLHLDTLLLCFPTRSCLLAVL